MKILMTTQPGLGHVHPMIPIAKELLKAGHEVIFACSPSFCPYLESFDLRTYPAGLDWLEAKAEHAFPELKETPLEQQPWNWLLTNVFADVATIRLLPDLFTLCHDWQPDIIVRSEYEFAACLVAEQLNLPYATVSVELFLHNSTWERIIGDQLSYLRSACGLAPFPAAKMLHRHLYLSFMPPGYESFAFKAEPTTHAIRPVLHDHTKDTKLPTWVKKLPPNPTIYVTLGTVYNRLPQIFQAIITGLANEPLNLILTVGSNQDPGQLGSLPRNVTVEKYIPQSLLLPYCDLAVTHGGHQTMTSILSQGLPSLTIPVAATHALRAMRSVAVGIGLAVKPLYLETDFDDILWENVPWAKTAPVQSENNWFALSPESVREAVYKLLKEPQYRQNAQQLREELLALPGPEKVVELLRNLVLTRRVKILID